MLAFGVKWLKNTFKKNMPKMESFYDFKEARHEKSKSFGYICIVGLFFVAISALFAYFYMKNHYSLDRNGRKNHEESLDN